MTIKELKIELLKQEIGLINSKINHFDDLRHRTKQMAITLWLAAVGVGLTAKLPILLWAGMLVPLPFWLVDTVYHAYQEGFTGRLGAIQKFIRSGSYECRDGTTAKLIECMNDDNFGSFPVPDPYGTHTVNKAKHEQDTSVLRNLVKFKPMLFYVSLVVAALLLALLVPPAWTGTET